MGGPDTFPILWGKSGALRSDYGRQAGSKSSAGSVVSKP